MPSKNSTLPAGVPTAGDTAATVAVIVTDSPVCDGFGAATHRVAVAPWFIVWIAPPWENTKSASPEYIASTVLLAPMNAGTPAGLVATPLSSVTGPPNGMPFR